MSFVADNSVIVAWFIGSQATPYTKRQAQRARREQVTVPPLWAYEFVNVLKVHQRREILADHQVSRFIRQAERLVAVDVGPASMSKLAEVAGHFDLSAYDAAYLELAMRLGLRLAVGDGRLRKAAVAAGILAP